MNRPLDPAPWSPDPRVVLTWALEHHPRLALVSALGPQSLVVIDLLSRMDRAVPVLLLDTGLHFPETYALRLRVQRRYGLEVRRVLPALTLDEQARRHGERLWERDPDRCCQLRKVEPLDRALQDYDAWITGLRRDQGPSRADVTAVGPDPRHGRVRVSPLWAWSRADVMAYLRENDVPYNELLDRGYAGVGCAPCTRPHAATDDPEDERAGRWAGSTKTECGIHFPDDEVPR